MSPKVTIVCETCGKEQKRYPSHARGETHYCSKECQRTSRKSKCDNCGDEIRVYPSNEDLDHHFCDVKCESEFKTQLVEMECDNCGVEIEKQPSKISGYENHFCSTGCHDKFRAHGEEVECTNCGDTIYRQKSRVSDGANFCSKDCKNNWAVGKNHHNWNSEYVKCWWCGDKLARPKNRRERSDRSFCDGDCLAEWKSWAGMEFDKNGYFTGVFDRDLPRWLWRERNGHLEPA